MSGAGSGVVVTGADVGTPDGAGPSVVADPGPAVGGAVVQPAIKAPASIKTGIEKRFMSATPRSRMRAFRARRGTVCARTPLSSRAMYGIFLPDL
jgi:hypothetical protein